MSGIYLVTDQSVSMLGKPVTWEEQVESEIAPLI